MVKHQFVYNIIVSYFLNQVHACACVRACVRGCVRACVRACVRGCVCVCPPPSLTAFQFLCMALAIDTIDGRGLSGNAVFAVHHTVKAI